MFEEYEDTMSDDRGMNKILKELGL